MPSETLLLFDPRRTIQLQGFSGRAATTTLHDATETSVSISGIFQAAEDFAVLCLYNAYDYFNHLRLKPLPRTDLSGLRLEFDIEYHHALDGAMRFDSNKYPSVSWDSVTFVCGAGDIYEVRLLDHATAVAGSETPASCRLDAYGTWPTSGLDWLHLYFRDTRYSVASDQVAGAAYDALLRLAEIINTPGAAVEGRYGPDQSGVVTASVIHTGPSGAPSAALVLTFATPPLPAARYGKLGNLDRVLVTSGHQGVGGQSLDWTGPRNPRFTGGDNDTRYRIVLDFTQPLLDKLGRTVPMNDCRKIYMVFAPRFEATEQELEDGCFLSAGVGPGDTLWQVDDSSKLTGGRYFIGSPTSEERVRLVSVDSATQITVERGYQGSAAGAWPAGARMKKVSPVSGFSSDVEWRCTISNIAVTGDRSLKVGGGAPRIEESDARCKYTGFWESYKYGTGWPTQWWSMGHAKRTTSGQVAIRYSFAMLHDLYLGTFLSTESGQITVSVDGDVATTHNLYLDEYGGTTANLRLRSGVAAGTHTVTITATGGYFYFDYLWPLVPQDVPDPPQEYADVSLAIDFDTDHGYKKPPAWHAWQLQKLGFKGHADVYMGVFWNNKRRRVMQVTPTPRSPFRAHPRPATWSRSRSAEPRSCRMAQLLGLIADENGMLLFAPVEVHDGFRDLARQVAAVMRRLQPQFQGDLA